MTIHYSTGQLYRILQNFQHQRVSGVYYIDIITNSLNTSKKSRSRVLILQEGQVVYGGLKFIDNQYFARRIGTQLNHVWVDSAIKFAVQKLQKSSSFKELLDIIVRIRAFKWEDIENIVHTQVVQVLEFALPYPGQLRVDSTVECDLSYGKDNHALDWLKLMQDVSHRQQEWTTRFPGGSYIDVVPHLPSLGLQVVTESSIRQHLEQWVDGKRSLVDIAEALDKDPLKLVDTYIAWAKSGWIVLKEDTSQTQAVPTTKTQKNPIVLSVDDSIIVQTMIQETLGDRYQLILANNAMDALKAIKANPIDLLLLDVTMPGIDGLEFCRIIRGIPKYRKLPVVMLTARNKFSDKLKGQIAGATHYLTKPFEPKQLLDFVEKCIDLEKEKQKYGDS